MTMKLGDTARTLREEFGLTQRAAADRLGVSFVHLSNLENDKARPSPELLEKFRDVYGVDLYVYAWCRRGELERLPKGMQAATRRLTAEWDKVIDARRRERDARGD
jgi:transcriptional regulator with XRE-family HTH domain